MRQVAFPLGGFLRKDVALVSMLPFDLSGAGYVKPFLGSGFGFHFWHLSEFIAPVLPSPCMGRIKEGAGYFFGIIIMIILFPSSLGICSIFPYSTISCANFRRIISPFSL